MKKLLAIAAIMLLWIGGMGQQALAGNGDGTGDGQSKPLMLISSDPGDGQSGVAIDMPIVLGFNKNVINVSVRDNNQGQFTLTTGGQSVPVSVLMADDQMEPEKKRIIVVQPLNPLNPGAAYTLTVGAGLTAKSGAVLGEELQITFTTEGTATPPAETAADQSAPSPNTSQDGTLPASVDGEANSASVPDSAEKESDDKESNISPGPKAAEEEGSAARISAATEGVTPSSLSSPLPDAGPQNPETGSAGSRWVLIVIGALAIILLGVFVKKRS